MKPSDSTGQAPTSARGLFLLVCAVGVAALVCDCWPSSTQVPRFNLHAAFGVLLGAMAVAQFRPQANFGRLDRQPSRSVYLVLYVVFGAQQLIRVGVVLWNRGTLGASHPAVPPAPENLRDFLVYGIIALLTIRALALLRSHARQRADLALTLSDLQHHK